MKRPEQLLHHTQVEITPAFYDIDPMNVVWHGHYVKYLEVARCALLDAIDYNYPAMEASGYLWPVVDLRLKYVRPARFNQPLIAHAGISEWENRLRIDYRLYDKASGEVLTKAYSVQVAVAKDSGDMSYITPAILRRKLGVKES